METNTKILNREPLVTILMLAYNREKFIAEAINSVINQDYKNWQLVIINDGSTDNTDLIIRSFNDSRIRYIQHKENEGLYAKRKESLTLVEGDFVAVLDSDDIWIDKSKLSMQVKHLLENQKCSVVGTFTKLIDSDGLEIGQSSFACSDNEIRNKILLRNQFTHSSILIRKKSLKKTTGYKDLLAEDMELILQLGKFGSLANIPKYMTAHRVHNESMNDHGLKMLSSVRKIITIHKKDYPNSTPALVLNKVKMLRSKIKKYI